MTGIESWGGVKVGALYGMLHRMESEGLVEPVRTEQDGGRPQRTVYAITDAGRAELAVHLDRALTGPFVRSTTVEAALKWPGGLDHEALASRLAVRREALAGQLAELVASRELHRREDHLSAASLAGFRRTELHLEAELAWHRELAEMLPDIAEGDRRDRPESRSRADRAVTKLRPRRDGAS
ncbi:PadR family transcriptional regulator [Microlunatus parietis]|uniref:PadR family transcriptional regulator n=1 Tax=Microlunatus parietis TaxID=682979 RepID=UPI0035E42FEC